jgi:hypothetical protein
MPKKLPKVATLCHRCRDPQWRVFRPGSDLSPKSFLDLEIGDEDPPKKLPKVATLCHWCCDPQWRVCRPLPPRAAGEAVRELDPACRRLSLSIPADGSGRGRASGAGCVLAVELLHLPHQAAGLERLWNSMPFRSVFGSSPLQSSLQFLDDLGCLLGYSTGVGFHSLMTVLTIFIRTYTIMWIRLVSVRP